MGNSNLRLIGFLSGRLSAGVDIIIEFVEKKEERENMSLDEAEKTPFLIYRQ